MTIALKVFAAMHEDISAPYIWLSVRPPVARPLAIVVNRANGKKVISQILFIDNNFRDRYNSAPNTLSLPASSPVIVMSEWYRNRLGVQKGDTVEFELKLACQIMQWLPQLRASLSHPDHNVRLAADLAIVSVFLGLVGLVLGIVSLIR